MNHLKEAADDRYLTPGQRCEERLKSVDYDVWLCGSCGHSQAIPYINHRIGYEQCPECQHRTLSETTRRIRQKSRFQPGLREITLHCHYCGFEDKYQELVDDPKTPSSSRRKRSSSYGGGGQSSGGGASVSWSSSGKSHGGGGKSSGGGGSGRW